MSTIATAEQRKELQAVAKELHAFSEALAPMASAVETITEMCVRLGNGEPIEALIDDEGERSRFQEAMRAMKFDENRVHGAFARFALVIAQITGILP